MVTYNYSRLIDRSGRNVLSIGQRVEATVLIGICRSTQYTSTHGATKAYLLPAQSEPLFVLKFYPPPHINIFIIRTLVLRFRTLQKYADVPGPMAANVQSPRNVVSHRKGPTRALRQRNNTREPLHSSLRALNRCGYSYAGLINQTLSRNPKRILHICHSSLLH
ncbi:hypothetical protein K469DRAFT_42987 [Zopfia rhizophila CBS 207.26]|uniref:Uncharacterized protein n=1 Tax=Zopfia rhizophila CBS 207.26 TaxID=1314779 RepID=A0A6A6EI70_9PEZI|nr:hypothetical protein K469DRAFT_42987 [Zopfia rhizophila CBS 207.26]